MLLDAVLLLGDARLLQGRRHVLLVLLLEPSRCVVNLAPHTAYRVVVRTCRDAPREPRTAWHLRSVAVVAVLLLALRPGLLHRPAPLLLGLLPRLPLDTLHLAELGLLLVGALVARAREAAAALAVQPKEQREQIERRDGEDGDVDGGVGAKVKVGEHVEGLAEREGIELDRGDLGEEIGGVGG